MDRTGQVDIAEKFYPRIHMFTIANPDFRSQLEGIADGLILLDSLPRRIFIVVASPSARGQGRQIKYVNLNLKVIS